MPTDSLPAPARYFPVRARYDVSPSLKPLGTEFGNGAADGAVFQLDARFPEYRANKLRCRDEAYGKYAGFAEYSPAVGEAVARWMIERLTAEHPGHFHLERHPSGNDLHCGPTGEVLRLDSQLSLLAPPEGYIAPPHFQTLAALAGQVQEDLAIISTDGARDWLSAYHVCAPSHWRPVEKRGQPFAAVHAPVPGMASVNRAAAAMVETMVRRGPWVRFVWGVDTSRRLNRHPDPPPGVAWEEWASPPLDAATDSPFTLRLERQVTWGLPEVNAAVFVIRLYQLEAAYLTPDERCQLRAALHSMSPESRAYKGLLRDWDALLAWLE